MRRRIAEALRNLADRVDRESAYCMLPAVFNYVPGRGRVITELPGVTIQPKMTSVGCPLFYKADLYDFAWTEARPTSFPSFKQAR